MAGWDSLAEGIRGAPQRQQAIQQGDITLQGQEAFGNTLKLLQGQAQVPGAQPMPGGQPPGQGMPGPSQPGGGMPQQGSPPPPQGGMPPQPQGQPGQNPIQMLLQRLQGAGGGQPPGTPPQGAQQPPPQGGMPGAQPQQGMPQGQPQQQPGGMPQGQLDWRQIIQKVVQANPGAKPAVIAAAVDRFLPLMNQMSQQQWREMSMQIRQGQLDQGQQRIGQGEERIQQGQERIRQGEEKLGERQREFDTREKRLEASSKVRQDQGYQRLKMQADTLQQRIIESKNKSLLGQWRTAADAAHKRAIEVIQATAAGMKPEDIKALKKEEDDNFKQQLEAVREAVGASTPTGGTATEGGDKTQGQVPKGNPTPTSMKPVQVKTPEEATALKPGTKYTTPDGQEMTR